MKKKKVFFFCTSIGMFCFIAGIYSTLRMSVKRLADYKSLSDKHRELFFLMCRWVKVKQEGKSVASYLEARNIREVAVYGMNHVGMSLINELEGTGIKVAYGIDQHVDKPFTDVKIFRPEDMPGKVDAVVVTAVTYFDEIKQMLNEQVSCPVISLEDMVYGI